ncbi:hypothetical protein CJ030_MR1G028865 [Morella rubra]|uniref:Uncharacterized protein n=1 Tax=Morella rubra TaxID=262757 RepID=A0A6A1WS71_9ROSI|nr:hypothetical protein CJ030_MR1G028865 [Morella rubra]
MALTRDTWVTVLCRKLRDWWHWVADGDLPFVASHGKKISGTTLTTHLNMVFNF